MTTTPPTTTNPTATGINKAINLAVVAAETLVTNLITTDMASLTGPMAPLAAWFLNTFLKPLISPIVRYIGGKFSVALQTVGTFTVIDVQVGGEVSAVSKALAALIAAEKTGDANAIKVAIQNYANAQSALTHDDGSAPPTT